MKNRDIEKIKVKKPPFEIPIWLQKLKNETQITIDNQTININFNDLEVVQDGLLGSGTFGTVKKMKHKHSGYLFAVKMISDNVTEHNNKIVDLEVHMRLDKENECPYLIKYYGAMHANSYIWILTEIMDTSLDTIYPKCTMSEQLISKIAHAVLNGLEFMNNKEILHRDIKPSNILLNINGKIKLCDFGISGFTKNSVCTSYRGCESYMSPEKLQNSKNGYSFKSDIWSLGISLIEVATKIHPFKGVEILGLFNKFEKSPPPELDSSLFSTEFCSFIKNCLYKDPDKRYSAQQLLNELFIKKYLNQTVNLEFIADLIHDHN